MMRIRKPLPWLIAIVVVAASLSLLSLLVAKAGNEFTASSGAYARFHAAPVLPIGPSPGARISIQSTNFAHQYIVKNDTDNTVVVRWVDAGSSDLMKANATWVVHSGLANPSCRSFESGNNPGRYLRHSNFQLFVDPDIGGVFHQDATFCSRPGNSGQDVSFSSWNFPDRFIRHYNFTVYISNNSGSSAFDSPFSFAEDTSWTISPPWA
jgi:non-reducing end alpha-L-arabinofuranosidase